MSKIFTAFVRNRIYSYLVANNYINTELQKGFWSNISGTVEHTEMMTHLINHARSKQRSLTISLIDLRNAFGEVHHDLLKSVLNFHHITPQVVSIICNIYTDYTISIATDNFITNPIVVERGVLQGDSLSPLLFNMCFNTLMVILQEERLNCLGYVYDESSVPRNWLQFADDTAIITSTRKITSYC